MNDVHFSSKSDDWATPQDLFDSLNKRYSLDLDVCASLENHKCPRYFDKEQDALKQIWTGRFWMNPPYGRQIGKWTRKAVNEVKHGNAEMGVLLLPARVDTKWFHELAPAADSITFLKGRLKFGGAKNSAPFPSCIVVLTPWTNGPKVYFG